jgi:cytochrome P450
MSGTVSTTGGPGGMLALVPDRVEVRMGAAERHEASLLLASRPGLYLLLRAARVRRLGGRVRRLPGLGWVVADPVTARRVLNDPAHFSLLGEGGVGDLWAQVLGDWVTRLFDGPGHADLRARTRDLFTERHAGGHVTRVLGAPLARMTATLERGGTVDLADRARVLVGRMVADLLGLDLPAGPDDPYRQVFASGERLASLAIGSAASTTMPAGGVAEAKVIVAGLTGNVAVASRTAPAHTLLGRCRELGLAEREIEGLAGLLLVAGTETAATAMARTAALLHDTGQQAAVLADPALIPDAVREGLRVTTPAPVIGRHVTADVEVGGRTLRAGERVLVLVHPASNAVGPFDVTRPYVPETRQLWFGAGRHLCLGAPVARAEVGQFLGALTATGRPWRVTGRRPARRVLIPSYASLRVALA